MSVLSSLSLPNSDILLAVLLVVVLVAAIHLFILKRTSICKLPPGPTPLPLIGNMHTLDLKRLDKHLMKLADVYGTVYTIYLGNRRTVVLIGYDAVKDALVNHAEQFAERSHLTVFETTAKGNGIIFGHGESWKQMRRFTLSTLRDFGMGKNTTEDRIIEETGHLIKVFESYQGQPFDATFILNSAASNILCSMVLGNRFDYKDSTFLTLIRIVHENAKFGASPKTQLYNIFPFLGFLLSDHKKVIENIKEFHVILKNVYNEYRSKVCKDNVRSYIEAFIIKQQEEDLKNTNLYFHEGNYLSLMTNLFSAGTETTSTTLLWGLLLMMKFPHIQKKVHEEIDAVIGKQRNPRMDDRKNMPYTDAVVHEIQRVANVFPLNLLHETTMDTHFRGYFIPKGTQVIPVLTSVLFDSTQWETPEEFNPSHFLDSNGKFLKKDAFLPFSAGRRICPGESIAKMELFLFFTTLFQTFCFCPPPGISASDLDLTPVIGLTSSPKHFKVCALKRGT
ncbi:cytochrome P450 2K6-like [Protopterus annectens]|uniref:cytochrome P450 2K6-like n=1 Tax=Protopterus annectens TaxID=7888 RepID=UPI001CFB2A4E|nr:cytochrome P450 2K6-like [Protopterus annectens]XP_043945462.1 cytochrome P450 2K6-like [Protopterus annectens]XP_043945464.1 cytochrome P450 2K6-like [Protopterus annectens]